MRQKANQPLASVGQTQPPEIWLYIGAPIVIASGLYLWLRERQLARAVSEMPADR